MWMILFLLAIIHLFKKFKQTMVKEFEMTGFGLMLFFLGIKVKQIKKEFLSHKKHMQRKFQKKFKMENCNLVSTPMECGIKLSKKEEGKIVDPTMFKSLIGSLRYLTSTRQYILYVVGIVSRYMKNLTKTHLMAVKRILRYIKGTQNHGLLYSHSNEFQLSGYSDSDWVGDQKKYKQIFLFYMGDTAFS
ncbi:hypothetical protein KFK09_019833 [Dendrobium nobile]|uniref:Mitochondrial protein n=1 Tax=Dendrobium nobile TaxID=94219 RepID=A0A8T3AXS3_DENNO|nr:hypothetical protein KFK09_019833 [Dendrobium nobile]